MTLLRAWVLPLSVSVTKQHFLGANFLSLSEAKNGKLGASRVGAIGLVNAAGPEPVSWQYKLSRRHGECLVRTNHLWVGAVTHLCLNPTDEEIVIN